MLQVTIPGNQTLSLEHLVLDYNGTLACDGTLLPGVDQRLLTLSESLQIHVITADTFGSVRKELDSLPCELAIIPQSKQDHAKLDYIETLGPQTVVAVGNGYNDHLMLTSAVLGMAVMQTEGTATPALLAADLVIPDILAALDLLIKPKRLIATLRN